MMVDQVHVRCYTSDLSEFTDFYNVKVIRQVHIDRCDQHTHSLGCVRHFYLRFYTGQALANFAGFVVAVSFSFFANARYTFKSSTTTMRYMLYVGFMGTLSAAIGWCADKSGLAPIITLIVFSAISLVCGFIYSKFIVFRDAK